MTDVDFRKVLDPEHSEELHEDLRPYLETLPSGWTCIRHPLVFSIMHAPALNVLANRQLAAKRQATQEAYDEQRWHSYIFLHERPYRAEALADVSALMDDDVYWEMVGSVWTDSENIVQCRETWHELLGASRASREYIMNEEERDTLAKLTSPLMIYRGFSYEGGERGASWTHSKDKAEWFARRFGGVVGDRNGCAPSVAVGVTDLAKVIAYFDARNEREIVVLPEDVEIVRIEEL